MNNMPQQPMQPPLLPPNGGAPPNFQPKINSPQHGRSMNAPVPMATQNPTPPPFHPNAISGASRYAVKDNDSPENASTHASTHYDGRTWSVGEKSVNNV